MTIKPLYIIISGLLIFGSLQAQSTDTTMTVDFQVTTSSPGGDYSPRNIGAIWIESSTGAFVKTLRVWGSRRKQYLYTWNSRTGGNTEDGVTGATNNSHGTRSAAWDFTDVNGAVVTAGEYTLRLELTDQHSQGPLYSFSFPFMGATETITPPEQSHFHSMQLSYDLTIVVGLDGEPRLVPDRVTLEQNFPNPFNPSTSINFTLPETALLQLNIFDLKGNLVRALSSDTFQRGENQVMWDGRNDLGAPVVSGVYLCRLDSRGASESIKMVYLK